MNHTFRTLVKETLDYIKTQNPKGWVFGTPEEVAFFQSSSTRNTVLSEQKKVSTHHAKALTAPPPEVKKQVVELKVEDEKIKSLQLKPPARSEEIRQVLQKIAPGLLISEQIPDDKNAKRIASAWKENLSDTHIVLLVLNGLPETIELMKNLAKAMQKEFGPVKLMTGDRLEQEKRWDLFFEQNRLQLIVASLGINHYPELLKYYRMIPANKEAFLGKTPLITLEPALIYKNSAEKKLELWKTLCCILKP